MANIARFEWRRRGAASRRLLSASDAAGFVFLLAGVFCAGTTSGFELQKAARNVASPVAALPAGRTKASLGSVPLAASLSAPSLPSGGGPVSAADRQVSWKLMIPNVLSDQKLIWLFPIHVAQGHHWKPALGFVAGTAALVALDPHDSSYFRTTKAFTGFNTAFSGRNTSLGLTLVPLSFYAVALARHRKYDQQTALLVGEAVIDSELLTTVMKSVDRRLRPRDVPPSSGFNDTFFESRGGGLLSGRGSFPSGHEIAAFSIATVFAKRYARHRWVPWVAYGLAAAVGFSRISLRAHFPSDVFAGAVLGYGISNYVVLRR
ncbi:MAG TPA: phosphatase PAP2 family protein [Terriglobia bacterium]|nr:phosphatase PAP2 family protein [Terriglobia bacterium]